MVGSLGLNDRGASDAIQQREVVLQIGLSLFIKWILLSAANAAAGGFAVLCIERVGYLHAFDNLSKRHALGIVRRRIVLQVDEHLGCAAVRGREGVSNGAARVRFDSWIIGNGLRAPGVGDFRIAIDPELRPASFNDAEEAGVVVVPAANQVV